MRKLLLLLTSICFFTLLQAQVSKTVNVATAGTLSTLLTAADDTTITNLTVTGSIDSLDFVTLQNMMSLKVIDLNSVNCKSIPVKAFENSQNLISIIIPTSVNSIEDSAFSSCERLTSIIIPSSVTSIGAGAFSFCESLKSITIPSSIPSIKDETFSSCFSLTSIVIPSSVTSIGSGAFAYCESLASITIPSSVTSIGDGAFFDSGLTSITIPSSFTSIGVGAFYGCNSLTSITIPSSVTSISAGAFENCSSLNSITIPSSITSIGAGAFVNCSSLPSINIPSTLTSIGDSAFLGCSFLTSIVFSIPSSITAIGSYAFENCSSLISVIIPKSVTSIGDFSFYSCNHLNSIIIPSTVTSIGDFAFCFNNDLKSIYANPIMPVDLSIFSHAFGHVDTTTCYLYVPAGSLTAYESAPVWNSFQHIIEMDTLNADSTISLYPEANTMSIYVQTTGTWSATSSVPWLSFNPASGTGNDSLKIIALANPTDSIRTGIVTVSSNASVSLKSENTKTITVTQAAGTGYTTGFKNLKNDDLILFPNPTITSFSINNEGLSTVEIYSINGKLVVNTTVLGKEAVSVSKLSSGIYAVKIITDGSVVTKRLVVE